MPEEEISSDESDSPSIVIKVDKEIQVNLLPMERISEESSSSFSEQETN